MNVVPKILLLITKADIGGAQVHVLEILKHLKDHYQFTLAAGEEDYLTQQARGLGIDVVILKHLKREINLSEDRAAYQECVSLLNTLKPNLLHTHSSKAGVIGRLAALRTGVPSLFTAHGWAFTQGAPMLQRAYGLLLESVLCRLIGSVITISDYDHQLAAKYHVGWPKRRFLVKNGVSQSLDSEKLEPVRKPESILQILAVGRLSPVKNHIMLLKALVRLDCPFHAYIIGEGVCHASLIQGITDLNLESRVSLLGEITQINRYLACADIFVLSSNYEGLPLSVLEAMSQSLPVVATDVGGVKEAVLDQKTGLLSPRGDVEAFSRNIEKLAHDSRRRKAFGENARRHYEQNFTASRMVDETNAIYSRLLSSEKSA